MLSDAATHSQPQPAPDVPTPASVAASPAAAATLFSQHEGDVYRQIVTEIGALSLTPVALDCGEHNRPVVSALIIGPLAIHPRCLRHNTLAIECWDITHVASGFLINDNPFLTMIQAAAAAGAFVALFGDRLGADTRRVKTTTQEIAALKRAFALIGGSP